MKHFSLVVSIMTALYVFPSLSIAHNENNDTLFPLTVAKSGCCKVRKSAQHPWVKTSMSYDQCKNANNDDGDKIYKSKGLNWWDRSC